MQKILRVLLVEDDRSIASALVHALHNSYHITAVTTGLAALHKADTNHFDIIVLDLSLPDTNGLTVCQQLREQGINTPVLILTADNKTLTKIHLLDAGANDYLTKPFSLGELKARLRVLTRPPRSPSRPTGILLVSGVKLDRQGREVRRDGVLIKLRRKEFAILEYLMDHAGEVVSRRALTRYAWPGSEDLWTNTIDVHIKYLRDKVDRPFGRKLIQTAHGIGYKFEEHGEQNE